MALHLRGFFPAWEKVRQVELHPVQPWLAAVTKADHVCVWDWSNQQIIAEFQLGGSEEEMLQDTDIARYNLKDTDFQVNPTLTETSAAPPSRSSTGHIKDVRFLDMEVAQVQLSTQHYLVNGTSTPPPSAEAVTALRGKRLLFVCGENKVLVYDLLTKQLSEVPRQNLEGKGATCVSFLFLGGMAMSGSVDADAAARAATLQGRPRAPGAAAGDSRPLAGVMKRPMLAFGGPDGIVRVLHYGGGFQPVARLVSGHKSAIQCISTFQARGVPWEQVVAGHSYGSMVAWEPFATSLAGSRDLVGKLDVKAHDKEVVGMGLACVQEDPEQCKRVLLTAGVDNRLVGWDPSTFKELYRNKLDAKAQTTCMTVSSRGFVASGTHTVLVGTEIGVLLSLHAVTGSMRLVCNLNGLVPAGQKKSPKIYWVAVHPLRPQIVALGTNTGTALLAMDSLPALPVAPLPLRSPLQAHQLTPAAAAAAAAAAGAASAAAAGGQGSFFGGSALGPSASSMSTPGDPFTLISMSSPTPTPAAAAAAAAAAAGARAVGSGSGVTYLSTIGDTLYCCTFETVEGEQRSGAVAAAAGAARAQAAAVAAKGPMGQLELLLGLNDDEDRDRDQMLPTPGLMGSGAGKLKWACPQLLSRLKVATDRPVQRAVLSASFDGSYVAVVWPAARQYALYRQGAATWDEISKGSATSVAWHATKNHFALVTDAMPAAPPLPTPDPKKKKGKDSKAEAAAAAAAAAARRSSEMPALVQVMEVSGRSVTVLHRNLRLGLDDRPVAVSSGPMLAVTHRKPAKDCDLVQGDEGAAVLQFHAWDDGFKVGPELPEPLILVWDQSLTFAALAYSSQVLICTSKPSFRTVASLPLDNVSCMEWAARQLYVVTDTHVSVVFVGLPTTDGSPQPLHVVTLASLFDGLAPPPAWLQPPSHAALVPTPVARPPGGLALLGPRDGTLWFVNSQGMPMALALDHPGLACMCLLAAGDRASALKTTAVQLPPSAHDAMAAFALDMDGPAAAPAVLQLLPGLSLAAEARLRIMVGHWPGALEAVQLLLQGLERRPAAGSPMAPPRTAIGAAGIAAAVAAALQPPAVMPMASRLGGPVYDALGNIAAPTTAAYDLTPTPSTGALGGAGALDESLFGTTAGDGTSAVAPGARPGAPFEDELDWNAPLRKPRAGAALSGGPGAAGNGGPKAAVGGVAGAAGQRLAAAAAAGAGLGGAAAGAAALGLDLGLEAAEKMAGAGAREAGRQAVQLLLRLGAPTAAPGAGSGQPWATAGAGAGAGELSPEALAVAATALGEARLVRLALAMVDLGMLSDLAALATAATGASVGPAAAPSLASGALGAGSGALFAAALSGRPAALSSALTGAPGAAGSAPGLASVQASARGLPSAPAALTAWKAQLGAVPMGVGASRLTVSAAGL